jgi:hypothetical protein
MYLQKVKAEKIVTKVKKTIFNYCFSGILKVNDENSKIRIQDPDQNPDQNPDPLVRGMDPRIRIHTKMSFIWNTGKDTKNNIYESMTKLLLGENTFRLSVTQLVWFHWFGFLGRTS